MDLTPEAQRLAVIVGVVVVLWFTESLPLAVTALLGAVACVVAGSLVLGQFFGGIAGYGRGVTLQGCESVTRSDLTETQRAAHLAEGRKPVLRLRMPDADLSWNDLVRGSTTFPAGTVRETARAGGAVPGEAARRAAREAPRLRELCRT